MYGASRPNISSGGTSQTKDEYHVLGTNVVGHYSKVTAILLVILWTRQRNRSHIL
jgi:hypothetical protein